MDKEMVVKKLQKFIKEFTNEKGEFSLVMLIPTDPNFIDSKMTLIVSASWLDTQTPKDAVELIVNKLRQLLNKTELPYITRVTVINSSDQSVKAINSAFNVKESAVNIENCNIFGVQIDKAILLESHKVNNSNKTSSLQLKN